jgi:hypothetical protein
MDGYSVQEAASVLGVAEGRVWELLARGVLLGTPEGDSMRVFLKAQPGPIAAAGTHDEPPRTNGNGGSHSAAGEASAFRELLTEFRNLTERYGQALLALGEARGEVAGLRSRVDQLESRLDLRLPPPLEAAPVAWESATIAAAAAEPAPIMSPPAAAPARPLRPKSRARKARSPREAVAGFADALARAQDPSAAELGESRGAPETVAESAAPAPDESVVAEAEAIALEPAAEAEAEPEAVAVADEPLAQTVPEGEPVAEQEPLPDRVAAADLAVDDTAEGKAEEPAPDVEQPSYSAVVVEPDWFADGDFAWLDAAEMEASGPVEVHRVGVGTAEIEQEAVAAPAEAAPEPILEPEEPIDAPSGLPSEPEQATAQEEMPAPQAETMSEPEPEAMPEPAPQAETMSELEPEAMPEPAPQAETMSEPEPLAAPVFEAAAEADVSFEAWQPPEPAVADAELSPEPPTVSSAVAVEEEVMWLGAEPSRLVPDEPPEEQRAQIDAWPAVDSPARSTEAVRPPLAMTEDELARLAMDEGWDEAEVAAIRAMITPVSSATVDLPGAAELHEAMAALEAVPVRGDPAYDVSRQWAKPASADEQPPRQDDWAFEAEPAPPAPVTRPPSDVTAALRRSVADPGWLRRRQGPAAAAYRRLRRLFPG